MTPRLFEPLRLRDLTIRNRVWLSPMCQYSCDAGDGVPHDWHLVHLGARAAGGFGLVMTEASAVSPEGRISPQDAGIWNDAQAQAWAPVTRFLRSQGAVSAIQLAHAGRKASTYRPFVGQTQGSVPVDDGGWATIAPSPLPADDLPVPQEMSRADIDRVVAAFADAARRADEAGFDVVEIHSAHGYLSHEFLSPLSNQRTDEYGGSFENRARFLYRVVDAVRGVWPEAKPVLVRVSGTDWLEGGWDIDQTVRLATELVDRGVDLMDMSSGALLNAPIPVGPSYQVPLAAEVKTRTPMPVGAVGLITTPAQAEEILAAGRADAIFLGRVALREPAWPQRAAAELGVGWRDAPYPPQYTRGAWPATK